MTQSRGSNAAWCLSFPVDAGALPLFETIFEVLDGAMVTGAPDHVGAMTLEIYLAEPPSGERVKELLTTASEIAEVPLPDYSLAQLPDVDWVAESQKALPPISAGRFFVYGSHVTERPPFGSIPLLVEANVAFGTGRHESTFGCLLALTQLAQRRRFHNALDMGCGSGILAMAMAHLWRCPVLAVDNDADSVRVAGENARENRVAEWIEPHCGDGYKSQLVARRGPFDLIVANILAEPLCAMATDLKRSLAPGGYVILAGLLTRQQRQVVARHRGQGLRLVQRLHFGEWTTLVLQG
ncbi:50S ribosomal protein L11 methyltransferase [Denitrobaculum tricleocarpae]|uniref:50S ribosomal protein L11 methyltransferase n=1 Tax=Denitrobaculum tricleocarpae TaxID=2591009 RepID=UPI0015D42025|nr:50S ribosomal protein L11 methyltransferase [Denitrobaculum tricleocarpae]